MIVDVSFAENPYRYIFDVKGLYDGSRHVVQRNLLTQPIPGRADSKWGLSGLDVVASTAAGGMTYRVNAAGTSTIAISNIDVPLLSVERGYQFYFRYTDKVSSQGWAGFFDIAGNNLGWQTWTATRGSNLLSLGYCVAPPNTAKITFYIGYSASRPVGTEFTIFEAGIIDTISGYYRGPFTGDTASDPGDEGTFFNPASYRWEGEPYNSTSVREWGTDASIARVELFDTTDGENRYVRGSRAALSAGTTVAAVDREGPLVPLYDVISYRIDVTDISGMIVQSQAIVFVPPWDFSPSSSFVAVDDPFDESRYETTTLLSGTDAERKYPIEVKTAIPMGATRGIVSLSAARQDPKLTFRFIGWESNVEKLRSVLRAEILCVRTVAPKEKGLPRVLYGVGDVTEWCYRIPERPRRNEEQGEAVVSVFEVELTPVAAPVTDAVAASWTWKSVKERFAEYQEIPREFPSYLELRMGRR